MSVRVEGGDLPGLKALMERMKDANRSVLVGVPAGAKEEDGTNLAMIAAVNEFGAPEMNIPERSFLRAGIRESQGKLSALNVDSLRGVVRGSMTVDGAIERLGVVASGEVKRKIGTGPFQALKPATIAARKRKFGKSSSKPLIASGQLRQSITFVLEGAQSEDARIIG